mmetsp:Transcript_3772/g.23783  ORF Transcript_3772/g.23783 Transcript_3772/m.23783 type:complete len:219 (+) Transcript_3772:1921-2577(+)
MVQFLPIAAASTHFDFECGVSFPLVSIGQFHPTFYGFDGHGDAGLERLWILFTSITCLVGLEWVPHGFFACACHGVHDRAFPRRTCCGCFPSHQARLRCCSDRIVPIARVEGGADERRRCFLQPTQRLVLRPRGHRHQTRGFAESARATFELHAHGDVAHAFQLGGGDGERRAKRHVQLGHLHALHHVGHGRLVSNAAAMQHDTRGCRRDWLGCVDVT